MEEDKLYMEHKEEAERLLNDGLHSAEPGFMDIINIVKASTVCNYRFSTCYGEVVERFPYATPAFVAAVYMMHKGVTPRYIKKIDLKSYNVTDDPVGSWDEYFFNVCRQAARNSKCLSRRIGAILVNKNKGIFATGYNGPPSGIVRCDRRDDLSDIIDLEEGVCPRRTMGFESGKGLEICIAAHAEANTINMCARDGVAAEGSTMYMTCGVPCKECMIKIIQVKIKELVVTSMGYYDAMSPWLLKNSNIKVRLYDFI
jgi:dCMP deaminase